MRPPLAVMAAGFFMFSFCFHNNLMNCMIFLFRLDSSPIDGFILPLTMLFSSVTQITTSYDRYCIGLVPFCSLLESWTVFRSVIVQWNICFSPLWSVFFWHIILDLSVYFRQSPRFRRCLTRALVVRCLSSSSGQFWRDAVVP